MCAWATVSALTLWGTCTVPGPRNALGAEVELDRHSIVGVQLLVRNESDDIWEDVVLTLDGEWRYRQATMRPHDRVVLSMGSFRGGAGAPPREYDPHRLVVSCGQGSDSFDLR